MKIQSYTDIMTIDSELACLFLRQEEAARWTFAVEHGIKEWIGTKNKQYWEVVKFVSERRGILGRSKNDKKNVRLTREEFAQVLLKFCPHAFGEQETVNALKSSMEHYRFATKLREFDNLSSGHLARHHVREVENLLDGVPFIESHEEARKPTMVDIVEKYLRREVDEQTDRFPCSRVCVRPQYVDFSPALSVETYKSKKFFDEHMPSRIDAYEFIDGVLQKKELDRFLGEYRKKRAKLYIVSPSGLLPNVRAIAIDEGIGYVRIDPHSEMTNESYILPRSIEDYAKRQHDLDVLEGVKPMTTPLLIMDGSMLTSSLADVLSEQGVTVKSHRLLRIPYLSENEMEKRADEMTAGDVENRIQQIKNCGKNVVMSSENPVAAVLMVYQCMLSVGMAFDPFAYAASCGLSYKERVMEDDSQLGCLEVNANHVILNSVGAENDGRYRFTMAHELGHYLLHSSLFRDQGVLSVGESEETLSVSESGSRRLEYQANKFAACLLMPEKLVRCLYGIFFDMYVHRKYGDSFHPLWYNPKQRETWDSYKYVVTPMTLLFNVSQQAMDIRLKSLGLLKTPD